jgi:hypothetical protein
MIHTKETGNLFNYLPNWFRVGQCGFGKQFMHSSKSVIGKDSKKHRVLQVGFFHSIHADGGASACSENCAWSTLEKLQKYNTEYDAFDSCHYCTLKSKHLGFNPTYV